MSTQINISYDDGGLRNANRQQAGANRLASRLRQNQSKVEAQGNALVAAQRAASGANARGQINDYPYTPPTPAEELAAYRRQTELPYFFWRKFTNVATNINTYKVISGNGSASVTCAYPTPDISFSILDKLSTLGAVLNLDESWTVLNPQSFTNTIATRNTIVFVPGVTPTWHQTIEEHRMERGISSIINEREFILPLGDRTALFVAFRNQSALAQRREYYHRIERVNSAFPLPDGSYGIGSIISESMTELRYDNIPEVGAYTETDSICVHAGYKRAVRVNPPVDLIAALTSLVPPVGQDTEPYTVYPPSCNAPAGSCSGFPASGEITTTSTYLFRQNESSYGDQQSVPTAFSYGVTYQGYTPNYQATPATWFSIFNSKNDAFLTRFYDHGNPTVNLDSVGGKTFGGVFKAQYIGIPEPLWPVTVNTFLTDRQKAYRWKPGTYMAGSLSSQNYPYSSSDWGKYVPPIPKSAAVNPEPAQFWTRTFIYDWDNPAFCKTRKSAYNISLTPFTP